MAFVYRSHINNYASPASPGPGHYRPQTAIPQPKLLSAPFNRTSPRKIWEQNNIPGPGSYSLEQNSQNKQTLIQNCGHNFALFQAPIQTAIFKSNSKRFKDKQENTPGPGQYKTETQNVLQEKKKLFTNNLQKYLQWTNKNQVEKQLNFGVIGGDLGRRNSETVDQQKKQKKTVPFNSKVERTVKVRPQTSLGPGSYDIQQAQTKNQIMFRKTASQSLAKFKRVNEYTRLKDTQLTFNQENSNQKISKKSFNIKKQDFFGSTVARFKKIQKTNGPGPGNYESDNLNQKQIKKANARKKLAFGRSSTSNIEMRDIQFSPFCTGESKKQKIESQNKPKPKIDKSFGTKQPRFSQLKITSDTNDSYFLTKKQLFLGKQNNTDSIAKFKKTTSKYPKYFHHSSKQIVRPKNIDTRPLCYAPEALTIAKKTKQKTQINAPFCSHAARFNETDEQTKILEQIIFQTKKTTIKQMSKPVSQSLPQKGIMDSNNPRFVYKQDTWRISPCSYDPTKPAKKEFNKLFL